MRSFKFSQSGQAFAESIIALTLISIILSGALYIGKLMNIQSKSHEALRYSLWERTIWKASGNQRRSAVMSTADLEHAVNKRFYTEDLSVIATSEAKRRNNEFNTNSLWASNVSRDDDFIDTPLVRKSDVNEKNDKNPMQLCDSINETPVSSLGMDQLSDSWKIGGKNIGIGLDLPFKTYMKACIETELKLPHADTGDSNTKWRSEGAMLTNDWRAGNEDEFTSRVNGLVPDRTVLAIVELALVAFGTLGDYTVDAWSDATGALKAEFRVVPNNMSHQLPRYSEIEPEKPDVPCYQGWCF